MQPHHDRFRRRWQLSLQEFYDGYCGALGVPKETVFELLRLLERLTGIPAGYLRPWDSLEELGFDSDQCDSLAYVEMIMAMEEAGGSEPATVGDFIGQAALSRRRTAKR